MGDLYNRLKARRETRSAETGPAQSKNPETASGQKVANQPPAQPPTRRPAQTDSAPGLPAAADGWIRCADLVWERRQIVSIDPAWWDFVAADLDAAGRESWKADLAGRLCLDTETTGLSGGSGTWAFLIGWCRLVPPDIEIHQFFMQDLGGEPAMIDRIDGLLQRASAYCSYNGSSFDLPLLRTRWSMVGREFPQRPHEDCLYPARRLWRSLLGSCSLSRIEAGILGFERPDDIPGAQVPQLYLDYLRSGAGDDFVGQLGGVFRHHACDIHSLAMLHLLLAAMRRQVFSPRWQVGGAIPKPRLGRFEESGIIRPDTAAAIGIDPRGLRHFCSPAEARQLEEGLWKTSRSIPWGLALARRYYRTGIRDELELAVGIWHELWERQGCQPALVAWLKYAEHRNKVPAIWQEAIRKIEQALQDTGMPLADRLDLTKRLLRIQRRLGLFTPGLAAS